MQLNFQKRFLNYVIVPAQLTFAAYYWAVVIVNLVLARDFQTLTDLPKLRDLAFAKFWTAVFTGGPTGDKQAVIPPLLATATGLVVELGPGTGSHLPFLTDPRITKIYGVEPSLGLHSALRNAIKCSHLTDTYEILSCGIEDSAGLTQHGISYGTVDTIISIQVLCSVPEPVEEVVKEMYKLLKPGGQFLVFEHIRSEDPVTRFVQRVCNLVWPLAVANCHMDRPMERYLRKAGEWEKVELETDVRDEPWTLFPRVWGRLVKAESLG